MSDYFYPPEGKRSWTNALCESCWIAEEGQWDGPDLVSVRQPFLDRTDNPLETCCECGAPTIIGLYIRRNPDLVQFPRFEEEPEAGAPGDQGDDGRSPEGVSPSPVLEEAHGLSPLLSEMSTDALGGVFGLSGSKAHLIRRRAVTILQDELGDEEQGQAIAEVVLDLARIWSETWMTRSGPT